MKNLLIFIHLLCPALGFAHGGGEMSANIGPDQGILDFKEGLGFKLSPEAIKRFDLRSTPVKGLPIEVPFLGIASTLKENNIYRIRDGYFLRIDFKEISRSKSVIKISSPSLKVGDEIVISGLGFLRVVEMSLGADEHDEEEEHSEEGHGHESEEGHGHHD